MSYLDSFGLPKQPFTPSAARRMQAPPQMPSPPDLSRQAQIPPAPDDPAAMADFARVIRGLGGEDDAKDSSLARIERILRGLPQLPTYEPSVAPPRTRAMTPLEGPDTGAVNPNASPSRAAFVKMMTPHALAVAKETGLDPRLVLAQSALETGWGASAPGNNYFGIKGAGRTSPTWEVGANGPYQTQASFRTYADPGASAMDYAKLLQSNSIYAPVLKAKTLDEQLAAMGSSGYATDPDYGRKLRSLAYSIDMPSEKRGGFFSNRKKK